MDSAFVAIVPTRPCPLFGRPVHRRDGSHRFRPEASPQALRIPPRGGHPALLDTPRGQRGVTPAFGYGAPHPSTCGTSTHLSTSLPSAHYEPLRHPLGPGALGVCWSCYQYDHPSGLPVLLIAPCRHAVTHHPGETGQTCRPVFHPTQYQPSPSPGRVGLRIVSFGAASVFTHFTACQLADSLTLPPFSRLRPLRCLRDRWDSYPAGTTFAGAGLSPAGSTSFLTAHVDHYRTKSLPRAPRVPWVPERQDHPGARVG